MQESLDEASAHVDILLVEKRERLLSGNLSLSLVQLTMNVGHACEWLAWLESGLHKTHERLRLLGHLADSWSQLV